MKGRDLSKAAAQTCMAASPSKAGGPNVYGRCLGTLLVVAAHLLGLRDGRKGAGVGRRGKEGQEGQEGHAGQQGLGSHHEKAVAAPRGGF